MSNMESPFKIGQLVFHRANDERRGIVTGVLVREEYLQLEVSWGDGESTFHLGCELTEDREFTNN